MRTLEPVLLNEKLRFPDPRHASRDGLVAIGGDLSVPRLLLAYQSGLFPWTVDPVSWWSPDPRGVIDFASFHIPRSLAKVLRKGMFQITVDTAFEQVVHACAQPGPGRRKTWIVPEFIEAYTALHRAGYAHSLECWLDGHLAGGIYGVACGAFFAGESMFHRVSNASKVALACLVERFRGRGFVLFDVQMLTPITEKLGGTWIPRREYLHRLSEAIAVEATF